MLATLKVRDLVLIEDVTLDFAPGLNVLTGETGAGKSILLDALGLAAGARAGARSSVRTGAAQGLGHRHLRTAQAPCGGAAGCGERHSGRRRDDPAARALGRRAHARLHQRRSGGRGLAARTGRHAGRDPRPGRRSRAVRSGDASQTCSTISAVWTALRKRRRSVSPNSKPPAPRKPRSAAPHRPLPARPTISITR